MSETNTYDQPLTDKEVAEKAKSMNYPGRRSHGKRPVKPIKPMVKDRAPKPLTEREARRTRRAAGLLTAGVATVGLLAVANDIRADREVEMDEMPTKTVQVDAGDTIETIVKEEVIGSLADRSKIGEISVQPFIDQAVDVNGGSLIHPGDSISIVEYPNQPGSKQAQTEVERLADGS